MKRFARFFLTLALVLPPPWKAHAEIVRSGLRNVPIFYDSVDIDGNGSRDLSLLAITMCTANVGVQRCSSTVSIGFADLMVAAWSTNGIVAVDSPGTVPAQPLWKSAGLTVSSHAFSTDGSNPSPVTGDWVGKYGKWFVLQIPGTNGYHLAWVQVSIEDGSGYPQQVVREWAYDNEPSGFTLAEVPLRVRFGNTPTSVWIDDAVKGAKYKLQILNPESPAQGWADLLSGKANYGWHAFFPNPLTLPDQALFRVCWKPE